MAKNMTINEITKLRDLEQNGLLRKPKHAENINNNEKLRLTNEIVKCLARSRKRSFLLVFKLLARFLNCVNKLKGQGNLKCPYEIETDYGSGIFFNAHECFKSLQYPKEIEKNRCFNNCYNVVLKQYIPNCTVLSGIAYSGKSPFLHSVISYKNYIIDFNLDLCMDEDLYIKLFNFEILSELSSEKVRKYSSVIKKNQKFLSDKGFSTMYVTFAFEDLIDYLQDNARKGKEEVEIVID